ncbi:hypothetical protein PG989_000492 [Apiospora arundinis]
MRDSFSSFSEKKGAGKQISEQETGVFTMLGGGGEVVRRRKVNEKCGIPGDLGDFGPSLASKLLTANKYSGDNNLNETRRMHDLTLGVQTGLHNVAFGLTTTQQGATDREVCGTIHAPYFVGFPLQISVEFR